MAINERQAVAGAGDRCGHVPAENSDAQTSRQFLSCLSI